MNLIIDASNLRDGGGVTHISEILNNVDDNNVLFENVWIFSNTKTLKMIKERKWLIKVNHSMLEGGTFSILLWKIFHLEPFLKKHSEHAILLDPAGTYNGNFKPYISMCRNMLIFDEVESARYGLSLMRLKFYILRKLQITAFNGAQNVIFISKYAKKKVRSYLSKDISEAPLIYHGVNSRFRASKKVQKHINEYSFENPFKLLYVSPITVYKHQTQLTKTIRKLRDLGYPITIDFVGGAYSPELNKFNNLRKELDPDGKFVRYHGKKNYDSLDEFYKYCDAAIFASTCENMPNILIESMISGSPIISSNYGPMPEFLGSDFPFFFDPLDLSSIEDKLVYFLNSPMVRSTSIDKTLHIAESLSWAHCADQTFKILFNNGTNNETTDF